MWLGGLLSRFSVQRFPGAAVAQVPAPVAAARPRQQFRAGVLGDGPDPLPRCGCAPPRRLSSRATGPGRGPSACTTCPCPGRSGWPPARPCSACGMPPASSSASSFLSIGRAFGPRLRKGILELRRTCPGKYGSKSYAFG